MELVLCGLMITVVICMAVRV